VTEFGSMKVRIGLLLMALGFAGCVSRPPTIAHVHIGHALTGVHVTPNHEGYFVQAEERAQQAIDAAQKAAAATDLTDIRKDVADMMAATDSQDSFGVKEALAMAANHIAFAATSDDASINVQKFAPGFSGDIARVLERCELISLLGKDVEASHSVPEAQVSVKELLKLARANLSGEDANGDGVTGATPAEYGLIQLRKQVEDMVARENPRYVTVDQWFLFNLVKLPNGKWVFDKLGRGGNIEGYK
jgi:hypothetical protein